jgi:DNA-binding transcriptional MerR regulator
MDKAPDAFRTISEVAEDLDLPQHVLRFWETRFGQIKPMKRGGGRRYYRPDDVDLLRGIRHLLYGEGYTIRGVQRILKDNGIKFVQSVWKSGAPQPAPPHGDDADTDDGAETIDAAENPDSMPDDDDATPENSVRAEPPPLRYGRATPATLPANEPPNIPPIRAVEPSPSVAPTAMPMEQKPGLAPDQLQTLRGALEELAACKRLLEAAMNEDG